MFLADLNIHSTFSDGRLTIPQIVDLYCSRAFGVIAITDHVCEQGSLLGNAAIYLNRSLTAANFHLYMEILKSESERAWASYRMVLIPGFELTKNAVSNSESAHVLGIGVSKFTSAEGNAVDLARLIRAQGGLAIAAHPTRRQKIDKQTFGLWERREALADEFDAWEVACGRHLFEEVLASRLPKVASSGFHSRRDLVSWKTVFTCERSPQAILEAIRAQDLSFTYYTDEVRTDAFSHVAASRSVGRALRSHPLRNLVVPEALPVGFAGRRSGGSEA